MLHFGNVSRSCSIFEKELQFFSLCRSENSKISLIVVSDEFPTASLRLSSWFSRDTLPTLSFVWRTGVLTWWLLFSFIYTQLETFSHPRPALKCKLLWRKNETVMHFAMISYVSSSQVVNQMADCQSVQYSTSFF